MSDYLPPDEIQKSRFGSFDINALETHLEQLPNEDPNFIHIGGPSAVGKTTLALILQSELSNARVLSIDSYLIAGLGRLAGTFSDTPADPTRPYIGGISPEVWELSLLKQHINELKAGRSIQVPLFDQTIKDRVGSTELNPVKCIILEGGQSFSDTLRDAADYKILVTAPLHDRLVRKAVRTHARYGRDDLDEIWNRYLTKDEPSWQVYKDEFDSIADQVFVNPANPQVDYEKLPLAHYKQNEGRYHKLTPSSATGSLRETEVLGLIESSRSTYQLTYAVGGRDLVNLPIEKQTVELLGNHYEISREER